MRARLITTLGATVLAFTLSASPAFAQATASVCTDGTTSTVSGRGACSGHGGVDAKATSKLSKAAKKADVKADKAVSKADAKVTQADKSITKAESKADKSVAKADAKADKSVAKAESKADKAVDVADKNAVGATASCNDGTYSHAKTHQGACSGHKGVAKFLK